MRPSKVRFVTACQQLLALGAVLAVLTPAAAVISLDVVGQAPSGGRADSERAVAGLSAYAREARRPSVLPEGPVDAEVAEYALTTPVVHGRLAPGTTNRVKLGTRPGGTLLTTRPVAVTGYGGVGLTWAADTHLDDHDTSFSLRTRTDGRWSSWSEVPYHDEHAPDPGSREARQARPGTDLVLVGEVDQVQVRSKVSDGAIPADLRMAVTAPGESHGHTRALPALETSGEPARVETPAERVESDEDGLELQAAAVTPKPVIYSRSQWGANESLRDRGSLRYFEIHAGFVHHTVNANDYTRGEVPGILRSIYAYHTQSRGWSDVGYNFLVDKFGRIWEGRAGGIDRPVVGAHTLGYNDYAFAMSAIGNFETAQPSAAMIEAYGSLMAWKLSLHGVDAGSQRQQVGPDTFRAINGHRDAGSTACPGRNLYARLSAIRDAAEAAQRGWDGRELQSDLAATDHPDLVVRRASDQQAFIIPTGGLLGFQAGRRTPDVYAGADTVVASPDLDGDRLGDLLVRGDDGVTRLRPGTADGFGSPVRPTSAFADRDLITAVGDLDEDGDNDLVARNPGTGRLLAYLGNGAGGFASERLAGDWSGYDLLAATGDVDGDGSADLLARDTAGVLWRFPGSGAGGFRAPLRVPGAWGGYDTISGFGNLSRAGAGDLLVRTSGGSGFVRPGRGDGTFGKRLGPFDRLTRGSIVGAAHVAGNRAPDVLVRRGDDLVVFAHQGTFDTGEPIATGVTLAGVNALLSAGDWDRDGDGDLITRRTDTGVLQLRTGDGRGGFDAPVRLAGGFGDVRLLAAAGDMTGDGFPDLMGQPGTGAMRLYPGAGLNGLRPSYPAFSRIDAVRQVPIGRWNADGAPDSLFRADDRLRLFQGNGPGGLRSPRTLGLDVSAYDWVVGVSDVRLTGHADVIVRARRSGDLYVVEATADGFMPRRFLGEGMRQYDLVG